MIDQSDEQIKITKIKKEIEHINTVVANSKLRLNHEAMLRELEMREELDIIYGIVTDIYYNFSNKAVMACLDHVLETVTEICLVLCDIDIKLYEHMEKYLAAWRSPNILPQVEHLRRANVALQHRGQRLLQLLATLHGPIVESRPRQTSFGTAVARL